MFRKPFNVKSNNAIRGSDRRKLKEHVAKSFPDMPSDEISLLVPNKETMNVMNILTHGEKTVTCYCLHKNPVLFEVDGVLLPTVYTLWKHPHMMISFKTSPNVFSILAGGADLLFPGVLTPPYGFPDFTYKSPCYVTLQGNGAAVAVGITACSRKELVEEGCTEKRVNIFHCFKDHLWSIGEKDAIPTIPDFICSNNPLEDEGLGDGIDENVELPLDGQLTSATEALNLCTQGSSPQESSPEELSPEVEVEDQSSHAGEIVENEITDKDVEVENGNNIEEGIEQPPELSPQEKMDVLLRNCFYQALLDAKKVELPILVSKFSSQYLHAACPEGQRIDVKKSSYKKMSKFLSEMQSNDLIQVKKLTKGVESITAMNIQNDFIMVYKASEFAQSRKICKQEKMEEEKEYKKQQNRTIEIRELFAVSAKVVPFFKLYQQTKGAVLSSQEVRKFVTSYVKDNELTNQTNKKLINLDALLTDTLFTNGNHEDSLTWDAIMTKLLGNMNPCHEVTCPGEEPIIRKGKMECIEVNIEKRMGNKKVTVVKNLELFGIDTKQFAQSLQQAAASSTAVNPTPGKNNSGNLVIVQGEQMKHVKAMLELYKVPLKYAKGLQTKK